MELLQLSWDKNYTLSIFDYSNHMYDTNSITSDQPIQKTLKFNDKPEMWIVWQARRRTWQHENDGKSPSNDGNHTSMLQLLTIKINKIN